ncbi:hypothetical protein C8T65DRAFT_699591 [Cerioporus squamosus]|nr:hypothetical protein C8T65DRAFT_699591 [Cerioporus squamosus]
MSADQALSNSPVGHLRPCPKCGVGVVTVPRLCEGKRTPENIDWWMISCSNYIRPIEPSKHCEWFGWREDIPKGPPPTGTKETRPVRRGRGRPSRSTVSQSAASSATVLEPAGLASSTPASGPEPPTTVAAPVLVKHSMVQANDNAEASKTIFVYWWPKDDKPRKVYEIVAPHYPKWHPKDSPELVQLYHVDKEMFEWWDRLRWDWVTASPHTARRDVSNAQDELHYRSMGVQRADGMPSRPVRRRRDSSPDISQAGSAQASPMKHVRSFTPSRSQASTPSTSNTMSRSGTPYDLTDVDAASNDGGSEYDYPPSSDGGSSRYPSRAPSVARSVSSDSFWLSPDKGYAYSGPSTPSSRRVSPSSSFPSRAFPGSSASTSALLTSLDTILPVPTIPEGLLFDENTELDPDAPRASGKAGWPLKYVVDMAIGFHVLQCRVNAGMPKANAFADLFDYKYNSSTWSDNYRAWNAASAVPGEVERTPASIRLIPMSASGSNTARTPLKPEDWLRCTNMFRESEQALLQNWASGNADKGGSVNVIKDVERAHARMLSDKLTVGWENVQEYLEAPEIPTERPAKGSKRNWAVDTYIAHLVRSGRMALPSDPGEVHLAQPSPPAETDLKLQGEDTLQMVVWRPVEPNTDAEEAEHFGAGDDEEGGSGTGMPVAGSSTAGPAAEVSRADQKRAAWMDAHGVGAAMPAAVAAKGFDRRAASPNQPHGLPLLCLLPDVPVQYYALGDYVTARVEDLVQAVIESALGLERNVYISVPERLDGQDFYHRIASMDAHGTVRVIQPQQEVQLSLFDTVDKPRNYRPVRWLWSFAIEQAGQHAQSLKHSRSGSDGSSVRSRSASVRHKPAQDEADEDDSQEQPQKLTAKRSSARDVTKDTRFTQDEVEEAVRAWLPKAENGKFGRSEVVKQIQRSKPNVGQSVLRLLKWAKVIQKMYALGRAGDTARPAGRGQRITQKILGDFVNRKSDWIRDALACRELVTANRKNEAVLKTLRALQRNRTILGMKKLRSLLNDSLEKKRPSVTENVEVDVETEMWSDIESSDESTDDSDDARELLGLRPKRAHRARVVSSDEDAEGDENAEGDEDAEENQQQQQEAEDSEEDLGEGGVEAGEEVFLDEWHGFSDDK